MKFQIFKLDVRKGRGPRDQIATGSLKKQENFRKKNIYFSLIDYAKVFDCVDHNKLWKILKDMGILTTLPASCETCSQETSVRTRNGKMDCFQIGKEYVKAVYCHPAYLVYMQSTSCKMLG